jgi:hypothetical protein
MSQARQISKPPATALDCGDPRLGPVGKNKSGKTAMRRLHRQSRPTGDRSQVRARAEHPIVRRGQDHRAHFGIVFGGLDDPFELGRKLAVYRIAFLRAVEGDKREMRLKHFQQDDRWSFSLRVHGRDFLWFGSLWLADKEM